MARPQNRHSGGPITGVVAALRSEARCLKPGEELRVAASGMGCARAARTAHGLVRAGAGSLLCWGVAGALDPALGCGDVVLASEVICQAPLALHLESMRPTALPAQARLRTCDAWRSQMQAALLRQGPVVCGPVLTSAEVICEASLKAQLYRDTGAVAVDMESAAVGVVARLHEVPFMVLRVIADAATDALPALLRSMAGSQALGPLSWVTWLPLTCVPSSWPDLIRLGRRYQLARRVLTRCARQGRLAAPRAPVPP